MHQQVRKQRKGTLGIVLASKPAVTGCAASEARNSIFINRVYPGLTLVCKAFEGFSRGYVVGLVLWSGRMRRPFSRHRAHRQQNQSGRRLGLSAGVMEKYFSINRSTLLPIECKW